MRFTAIDVRIVSYYNAVMQVLCGNSENHGSSQKFPSLTTDDGRQSSDDRRRTSGQCFRGGVVTIDQGEEAFASTIGEPLLHSRLEPMQFFTAKDLTRLPECLDAL